MASNKDRSEPGNEATNDRSYRRDGPRKIGVFSDDQPDLVTPSGVNEGSHDPSLKRQPSDSEGPAASTPNSDMQAEDAGSTDSGTAATRAMKQSSKTAADTTK